MLLDSGGEGGEVDFKTTDEMIWDEEEGGGGEDEVISPGPQGGEGRRQEWRLIDNLRKACQELG